jgi:hypothetical protein
MEDPQDGAQHTILIAREQKRADFSDLVGRWTPDPAFDEITAAQRQIDLDKWRSPVVNDPE